MAQSVEAEFYEASLDYEVKSVMASAKNVNQFYNNRLMVPSTDELRYLMGPKPSFRPYQATSSNRITNNARPSSGSPPPTPKTSGAGAAVGDG